MADVKQVQKARDTFAQGMAELGGIPEEYQKALADIFNQSLSEIAETERQVNELEAQVDTVAKQHEAMKERTGFNQNPKFQREVHSFEETSFAQGVMAIENTFRHGIDTVKNFSNKVKSICTEQVHKIQDATEKFAEQAKESVGAGKIVAASLATKTYAQLQIDFHESINLERRISLERLETVVDKCQKVYDQSITKQEEANRKAQKMNERAALIKNGMHNLINSFKGKEPEVLYKAEDMHIGDNLYKGSLTAFQGIQKTMQLQMEVTDRLIEQKQALINERDEKVKEAFKKFEKSELSINDVRKKPRINYEMALAKDVFLNPDENHFRDDVFTPEQKDALTSKAIDDRFYSRQTRVIECSCKGLSKENIIQLAHFAKAAIEYEIQNPTEKTNEKLDKYFADLDKIEKYMKNVSYHTHDYADFQQMYDTLAEKCEELEHEETLDEAIEKATKACEQGREDFDLENEREENIER